MKAFYNEIDPFAAQWLRELIKAGEIADGIVDERDIRDITPDELFGFTQVHLFAGIGVWSHALRKAGWPDNRPVWTGSCPCQPFSAAGRKKGITDERHLWPHWFHLISQCRPDTIFGEQVAKKDGLAWLDLVQADLEAVDYACGAVPFPAAGVGAPHLRERLYFVAHDTRQRCGEAGEVSTRSTKWFADDGAASELAHTASIGRTGQCREREKGITEYRENGFGDMDHTLSNGRNTGRDHHEEYDRNKSNSTSSVRCVGNPKSEGSFRHGRYVQVDGEERREIETRHSGEAGVSNGAGRTYWSDADWVGCSDGKSRPIEPITFPLAHGSPARVGRLRGYGNALVAEQAIAFIESYLEAA